MHAQRLLFSTLTMAALAVSLIAAPGPVKGVVGEPDTFITAGPSGWTRNIRPTFSFNSNVTGAKFECHLDTGTFAKCVSPFRTPRLADGEHSFFVRAVDGTTPDSTPATTSFTVDTTPPYTDDPQVAFYTQGLLENNHVPYVLTWEAGDNLTSTVDLVYAIQYRQLFSGGWGVWRRGASKGFIGQRLTGAQALDKTLQFRVRAVDLAGNVGAWVQTDAVAYLVHQEGAFTYSAGWKKHAVSGAWGGRLATSSTPGAQATLSFTGTGVAIVTRAGPGIAEACVDPGTLAARCVAFSGGSLAALDELTSGDHVLRISVVSGTINLDAAIIRT